MKHAVSVVTQPAEGGDEVITYVAFDTGTATQFKVTAAFNEAAEAMIGALGGGAGITVVDTAGPVPSLFVPVTVMVYVVPLVSPVSEHILPPRVEHVALPGVATTVYVTSGVFPVHVTTAPESAGTVTSDETCNGIPVGMYSNLLGVCGDRPALKYVIRFSVALVLSQFHAGVSPLANDIGAIDNDCRYRAIAPLTNGVAIDVPERVAYVFVLPLRYGYAETIC
jgi:hypothetical protein